MTTNDDRAKRREALAEYWATNGGTLDPSKVDEGERQTYLAGYDQGWADASERIARLEKALKACKKQRDEWVDLAKDNATVVEQVDWCDASLAAENAELQQILLEGKSYGE